MKHLDNPYFYVMGSCPTAATVSVKKKKKGQQSMLNP